MDTALNRFQTVESRPDSQKSTNGFMRSFSGITRSYSTYMPESVESFGERKQPSVTYTPIQDETTRQAHHRPWKTTFFRVGPLLGILCMMTAIVSLVACAAILVASDQAPVANWSIPPSTYIAICTAIANLAMRCACYHGVIVAWWYRALRGSTLRALHHDYFSGTSLNHAITSIFSTKRLSLLGLACIASTIVVIDGPLAQRSSTVDIATITTSIPLSVNITPEVPRDFTGYWQQSPKYDDGQIDGFNQAYNETMPSANGSVTNTMLPGIHQSISARFSKLFYEDAPLTNIVTGCPGECKATIKAPALAVTSCVSHELAVNYNTQSMSEKQLQQLVAPSADTFGFSVSTNLMLGPKETIDLVTGFGTSQDCKGTYTWSACTLESAIGEYDVTIVGNKATLTSPGTPKIIALANNTHPNTTIDLSNAAYDSTLAGVVALHWDRWQGYVSMFMYNGSMSGAELNTEAYSQFALPGDTVCPSFSDPKDFMIASLNKLMVYAGVVAVETKSAKELAPLLDPGVSTQQAVTGELIDKHPVYNTNFRWFLGAAVLELVCICLVAPTYWGWWRLGRSVSFSPLEIAHAFEAPAFENCDSNSNGRDLAKAVGSTEVKYGAVTEQKLAFGGQRFVQPPANGSRFGD